MLEDVEQATDRLTDLTGDLLDVTRLQSGRNVLQYAPTNIVSLIQRVVERLRQTTTRHSLELQAMQETLEATIDAKRIEQVLINLLSNAIKYSPWGGVITVCLAVRSAENIVEIRVQGWSSIFVDRSLSSTEEVSGLLPRKGKDQPSS